MSRRQTGFTLLEVVIATTILGVMMLLLTGSLRIGAQSWDAGEERLAKASRLYVVTNFLRTHIGSLLPVAGTRRDGEIDPAFKGTPESLEYVAALPEQVKAGGLYRFQIYLAKNGEHQDLRVAIVSYVNGPDRSDNVEPIDDLPLLENVKHFKASYLPLVLQPQNILSLGETVKWVDDWQVPQLPGLVRLDIELEGEEPWPPLVIAPKTQMLR